MEVQLFTWLSKCLKSQRVRKFRLILLAKITIYVIQKILMKLKDMFERKKLRHISDSKIQAGCGESGISNNNLKLKVK